MKQLTLVIVLFLLPVLLTSQNYVPMAVDSATWIMGYTDENPGSDEIIVMRIEGDTIVNALNYKKIYYYQYVDFEIRNKTRQLIGLIRDNLEERKVYGGIFEEFEYELYTFLNENSRCNWGNSSSFSEHLLYDFSLQEGDSIDICMLTEPTYITEVDSVERFGYHRFNYELEHLGSYTMMTEGIGTCIGIFKGFDCFFTGGGYTYSMWNYCIGSFSNCNLVTSTKDRSDLSDLVISPNPVTDILYVKSPVRNVKMSLFDMQGRLISSHTNSEQIDLSNYKPGIYILKVEDTIGNFQLRKVIKN